MSITTAELSDENLMALICERDGAALAMLYDRHHRAAFSLAYRILNDFDQAEDVVQEAFLAVWRSAASFSPSRGHPRAWLLTIVHHRAINQLRRGQLAPGMRVELDENLINAKEPEAWRVAFESIRQEDIRQALAQLPDEQRTPIDLAYFAGLSHSEIAERLAVPLGTVKSRIRLGFRKLQNLLSRYATEQTL
jgi:RNA polymerase sigma-70 factor (ECF subfamily)